MTDDRSLERAARSWLDEGPSRAPDRTVEAALLRIQTTTQERDLRIPWRFPTMLTNRVAVATLAIVLIVAGGAFALSRLPGVGQGGPSPTPIPTPSPTPLPTITASSVGNALPAGTYQVEGFDIPFRVTLPAGWTANELTPNSVGSADARDGTINIYMAVVDQVYPDPCHPSGIAGDAIPVGPGVDALVAALSSVAGFQVTNPADATVGGAHGRTFNFGNDINIDAEGCSSNPLPFATYAKDGKAVDIAIFSGETDQFWVLDADGTRLFMAVTGNQLVATQQVRDSLVFGP